MGSQVQEDEFVKILFHTTGIRVFLSALEMDDPETKAGIKTVYPTFELITSSGEPYLKIVDGGVTGYESISIKDLLRHEDWTTGWSCCAGTKSRWDSLRISGKDMEELREYFQEQQNLMEADGGSLI